MWYCCYDLDDPRKLFNKWRCCSYRYHSISPALGGNRIVHETSVFVEGVMIQGIRGESEQDSVYIDWLTVCQ